MPAAGFGPVIGNRAQGPIGPSGDILRRKTSLYERVGNSRSPALGEQFVVGLTARIVGMTLNNQLIDPNCKQRLRDA